MDLIVFAAVLPWLLIVFGCWLYYQLIRQNGRLLLRIEALQQSLERRGAAEEPAPSAPTPPPADVEQPPAPSAPTSLPVGSTAPAFELPDLDGDRMALHQFRGQRLVLIFFNPDCGFCRRMVPELAALIRDETQPRPLPVVITTGSAEENQKLFAEHEVSVPVLLDEDRRLRATYLAGGTPMGYLIDEQGRIASGLAVGTRELLAFV